MIMMSAGISFVSSLSLAGDLAEEMFQRCFNTANFEASQIYCVKGYSGPRLLKIYTNY
jgi:hypothetical protein